MDGPIPQPPPDGNVNRGPALLACIWIPVPFTIILLSTRVYVRLKINGMGIDDYLMIVSWFLYIATFSIETANILSGGTRHIYYLLMKPQTIVQLLKLTWIAQPIGIMASALGKCSVAFLLRRIIGPNTVWRKYFLYFNMGFYMAVSVVASFLAFCQCKPADAIWAKVPDARCWNPNIVADFDLFQSSYGAAFDFFLAILPISLIWGLQLSLRKRIAICILLGLGAFAGICASVKTASLRNPIALTDFTWSTFDIWVWTSLEISLVIICGCIPTLKPLWDQVFSGRQMSAYGSSRYPTEKRSKNSYALQSASSGQSVPRNFGDIETSGTKPQGRIEVKRDISVILSEDDTQPLK